MDGYKEIVGWLAIAVVTAPIWGVGLWVLWQGVVRPQLIPRGEVERHAPYSSPKATSSAVLP